MVYVWMVEFSSVVRDIVLAEQRGGGGQVEMAAATSVAQGLNGGAVKEMQFEHHCLDGPTLSMSKKSLSRTNQPISQLH